MIKSIQIHLATILVLLLMLPGAARAQRLHLVTVALPPLAPSGEQPGFADTVAREAFHRIGIDIDVSMLPGDRALLNVNSGLDDGDLLRSPAVERDYPNLVRVPEKMMDFDFVAYAQNQKLHIDGFAGLKPYVVGYVAGWKIYEQKVKDYREQTSVPSLKEMFLLLKNGRAEVVLADRWQGLWAARNAGVPVHVIEPPLVKSPMYLYLNKRHAALVPKLSGALMQMKADGTYQRIVDKMLRPLELP